MKTQFFKSRILASVLFIAIFASCQKKSSEDACSLNTASIAGAYKLTGMVYKQSSTAPGENYLILRDACEQDDLIIFEASGVFHYKDAGGICSPNGSGTSTWSLTGNTITIDGDAGIIEQFDCSQLVVKGENVLTAGDVMTVTYKKQ